MFRTKPPRQIPGQPASASLMNRAAQASHGGIVAEPPLEAIRLGETWCLRLAGRMMGLVPVRATEAIGPRTGRTYGRGAGTLVTIDPDAGTSSDIPGAITLLNPSGCELQSGWEGDARALAPGVYKVVALG